MSKVGQGGAGGGPPPPTGPPPGYPSSPASQLQFVVQPLPGSAEQLSDKLREVGERLRNGPLASQLANLPIVPLVPASAGTGTPPSAGRASPNPGPAANAFPPLYVLKIDCIPALLFEYGLVSVSQAFYFYNIGRRKN